MIVQAFWHGPLGVMERMCINSYLRHGIDFHLYTYSPIPWEMPGLKSCDAHEIVPESKLSSLPSISLFSDYFRYSLLAACGGWWVDMDTICLRPFTAIDSDYAFASDNIDHYYISGCFLKTPRGSPLLTSAIDFIDCLTAPERAALGHMDIGPYLLQREVTTRFLDRYVQPPLAFDPIPWNHITRIVDPAAAFDLSQSYAIHLRQSIWNGGPNSSAGILPDGRKLSTTDTYPAESLWEQLKRDLS